MSAPDLHKAIAVAGGQVVTSGAALGSAPMTALLSAYFGEDKLTIAAAAVVSQPSDADVVVRGAVTLLGVAVTGQCRFFVDGDVAQLEWSGAPPAGWTLGASFAILEGRYFDTFALASPRLSLRSQPSEAPGCALEAGFTLPAPLEALRWFVAPDAAAKLGGPIALDRGLPAMTLTVSPSMKASLGGYVDIDLTMQHVSVVQQGAPQSPPALLTVSRLTGALSFQHDGKSVAVPMQAAFNDHLGMLRLQLVTGAIFDLALDEIAHWIGGADLSTAGLPAAYRPPGGLTLHDVVFAIGVPTKSLAYVKLTIASTEPWIVVDKVTISNIVLSFTITPGAVQTLAVTIAGTLELGDAVSLDVYALYPNFAISGHLTDGTSVDLVPLLAYLGATMIGVPSTLRIDTLNFDAEPSGGVYGFELDVAGDWHVVKALAVENLKARLAYANRALDLFFAGKFTVGGVDLAISAEYESELGGWFFAGRVAQNAPIQIGAFIAGLARDFSSTAAQSLPDFIATLEIGAIAITFDTASKDFDFRCETKFEIDGTPLDLTLHISLRNGAGDSYTHLFAGLLVIGAFAFELVFEDAKSGAGASSTLLAAIQPKGGVDVRALVAGVSAEAGALMPALTLTLENALFLYRKTDAAAATYLFGLAIGLDINLQALPLIGPVLRDAGIGGIKDVQALYASAPVSADDAAAFNALLGEATAKPALPSKKGASGATQVLSRGFNFAANLDMGGAPISLSAGGADAPAKAPAQTGSPATLPAPPSGGASWFDVRKSVGPLTLNRIGVRYEDGRAWLLVDADFTLSGLALGLQGLALGAKLDDPKAIAVNIDGMSIDFASGPLTISGGFLHLGGDFIGEARVQAATFGLTAIGGYAPDDKSFFIFVRLNAPLGGPPFFFITGVAGGFGINRTLTIPPIDDLTKFALLPANNKFPTQLGASDPGATLAATLATTEAYIHPQAGMNWVAAGLDFTSFEMVDSSALATVAFGIDFTIALLGVTRLTVPKLDPEPIVYLEITLEAQLKPSAGLLAIDGRITPASFLFAKLVRVSGGFAFYLWFAGEHEGDFVISIGGYHPRFQKPDHYPIVPRLQLAYQVGNLVIVGQTYIALTPHMVMAGLRIDATWDTGALKAWFSAGVDFLLGWRPFHYEGDAYIHIGVSLTLDLLFTSVSITVHVGADLDFWGPQFGGRASIDLDIVSFTISFGADPRKDALDWPGFAQAFLPAGKTTVSEPAHRMLAAMRADAPPIEAGSLWCVGSVPDGLVKDLKAADTTSFFAWLVDANHFALETNTLIPAKQAIYNAFALQTPFTLAGGFKPAAKGDTPTPSYDAAANPGGLVWATDFGVLPVGIASKDFTSALDVRLLRPKPGTAHTDPANYVDAVDVIAVMPRLKSASAALWAGADPGLNGARLIDSALVGLQLSPMAQHPDITFKADLWAMLFDEGPLIDWAADVPAADTTDSYAATSQGGTLTFTLAGEHVECKDYKLSALSLESVAKTRANTIAALASLGITLDPGAVDVANLAAYPLWDWPAIQTLGEERSP